MKPKQKTNELVEKFYQQAPEMMGTGRAMEYGIKCAVICVGEILDALDVFGYSGTFYDCYYTHKMICNDDKLPDDFWQEVKQEIEKL